MVLWRLYWRILEHMEKFVGRATGGFINLFGHNFIALPGDCNDEGHSVAFRFSILTAADFDDANL